MVVGFIKCSVGSGTGGGKRGVRVGLGGTLGGAPRSQGDSDGEEIIARDGSSSPTLCTSRTGAGGAPCSGPTRPGHPASPGVAGGGGTEQTQNQP